MIGAPHGTCEQGWLAMNAPPASPHVEAEVVAHPPGRQHAPNTVAELHAVALHTVPVP